MISPHVRVEPEHLPDGRAIRFFSWAPDAWNPDAEWAPTAPGRPPAEPPAPTQWTNTTGDHR